MTPKEKALELYEKFTFPCWECDEFAKAKESSLIAVDEIIGQWEIIDVYLADGNGELNQNLKYWYTVKKEIDLL